MIPTKFGMANIKKTAPTFIVKQSDVKSANTPSSFQKRYKIIFIVSELNSKQNGVPI